MPRLKKKKIDFGRFMKTKRFERKEYPRPQWRREDWQGLNGEWEFCFDDEKRGEAKGYPTGNVPLDRKINVPFAYQSAASGIGDKETHETVWYRRTFGIKDSEKNVLLCFNGADYRTSVWVNGALVVTHTGGYTPFQSDITRYLKKGENVLVAKCEDGVNMTTPRGKQSFKNGGKPFACWYVPSTGIWQSVWLETFKTDCISRHTMLSDADNGLIYGDVTLMYGIADELKITVKFEGELVCEERMPIEKKRNEYAVYVKRNGKVRLWDTSEPNLYYVDFALYKDGKLLDLCHTRLGMRSVTVENGKICLNHRPFYQRLVLDQGYFENTDLTPPSAEALKDDILLSMQSGFNGARKHQKTEDPYYAYYAEELGFVTWCEMPSAYDYCDETAENLISEWAEIVSNAKNQTSNICYVPLNESWGVDAIAKTKRIQNFAAAMYHVTKAIDPTRLVSTNDGWENVDETDVISVHDYAYDDAEFDRKYIQSDLNTLIPAGRALFSDGAKYHNQPILFTEFGGVAMQSETSGENWGYGVGAEGAEEFYARVKGLIRGIKRCPFQGYCFTQLTDVQQEVNGILDYGHKPKFDTKTLKEIFESVEDKA